jgi:purine nucleosidase
LTFGLANVLTLSRLAKANFAAQTCVMTRVLIDCDPGLDDAVALLAAFGSTELDVVAVTTVAGNVTGPQTAINAQIIREAAGNANSVPVCAGAPGPLLRDAVTAEDFHGTTGLGDIEFPTPNLPLSDTHSVNMIVDACRAAQDDPIIVILTGPMTNLALALTMAPDIASGISEVILMGGADTEGGNITPYAEFNVFADPHAAAAVYGAVLPIRCLSLDVTHRVRATDKRIEQVCSVGNAQAELAGAFLEASCKLEFSANGAREAPLHDPSTVIALTQPALFTGRLATVEVVTAPGAQFGRTIPHYSETGNVMWYQQADDKGVFDELSRLLGEFECQSRSESSDRLILT